jgi:hypothetical protein
MSSPVGRSETFVQTWISSVDGVMLMAEIRGNSALIVSAIFEICCSHQLVFSVSLFISFLREFGLSRFFECQLSQAENKSMSESIGRV